MVVNSAKVIAASLGMGETLIGLTVVAIGTSLPELVTSIVAAKKGDSGIAMGNVVGSNIFNTLIILGITALISPLTITRNNIRKDIPVNFFVTILLLLLGMNFSIFKVGENVISRFDGIILLAVFAWYLWSSFRSDSGDETEEGEEIKTRNIPVSILMIVGGLGALVFGGRLFVNSATALAQMFGVSDKFMSITVMAAGTSMPELATCVVAALKGRGQLALGNILGSNIGNILLILGGSALIHPLSFSGMTIVDIIAVAICPVFIYSCAFLFRKKEVDRAEGIIFLLTEAAYMWYLISNL